MKIDKSWRLPLFFSGLILLSQAFPLSSPVRDASTGAWMDGFSLQLPTLYVLFAPFCGVADRLTLLSYHQAVVSLAYTVLAFFLSLGLRRGGVALLLFLSFLAWTILIPHPQAKLVPVDPDTLLIDFHSHSNVSHDGRPSFTAERNMQWHQNQGYGASFITEHNRIESSQKAKVLSRADWQQTGYRSLEGEEISLFKTHLVVLGVHERIDNRPYDSDPAKIRIFLSDMRKKRLPVIASIPEYWLYHWQGSPWGSVDDFVRWGVAGFEIINSAPKALDFPPAYRRQIVELCQKNKLLLTGISDTHGWGSATAVWNAMRIPGWQAMDPDRLEAAVLKTIKTEGFNATNVLERTRYNPENMFELLASPFANAALYGRSLQMPEAFSWVVWIWMVYGIKQGLKRIHA